MINNTQINEELRIRNEILKYLSPDLSLLCGHALSMAGSSLVEIRLRAGKPLIMQFNLKEYFIDSSGLLATSTSSPYILKPDSLLRTLEMMTESSIYAYQEELRNGFITIKGGHRVGISGRVVLDGQTVKNIKDFNGMNIRVSREVRGCAVELIDYIITKDKMICNTLIISPPLCGKTTILRDIARILSDGETNKGIPGVKVGIVDERSEIAGCLKGIPQLNVGIRTDVLDGCPKSAGMYMMIRSMSPCVIITDELGGPGDRESLLEVVNAGVKVIASTHGYSIDGSCNRQEIKMIIDENLFERYIVLDNSNGPGTLKEVADGKSMELLYRRKHNAA